MRRAGTLTEAIPEAPEQAGWNPGQQGPCPAPSACGAQLSACRAQVPQGAPAVSSPPLPRLPFHNDSRTRTPRFSQHLAQFNTMQIYLGTEGKKSPLKAKALQRISFSSPLCGSLPSTHKRNLKNKIKRAEQSFMIRLRSLMCGFVSTCPKIGVLSPA